VLCDVCGIDKRFNQTTVETLLEVFSTTGVQSEVSKVNLWFLYDPLFESTLSSIFLALIFCLGRGWGWISLLW
jgi:hypothetical protein